MFGKKDKGAVAAPEKEPQKAKKVTPQDTMTGEINALEVGKEITYKLGPIYVKPFITIVRNATGKRFVVYQDAKDAAGKPAGKRAKFWDENEAKDIAHWILEREGTIYRG